MIDNKKNKKKILIVGGTGFLGYHLARICRKTSDITCISLSRPSKNKKLKSVEYIRCDISRKNNLKKKIIKKYDIVINLGGYIDHINKKKTYNSHYLGCKNLINFFLKKKIELFVQIGSSSEYGKIDVPHKDKIKGHPSTIYGYSKLKASKYLFKFYKKKFPFTIIRFYQVYGPNQNSERLLPTIINSALESKNFYCSSGYQNRDFLYVEDATRAIIKCFDNKKIIGKIINIGYGKQINIKKLIKKVVLIIGKGTPVFGKIKLRSDEPLNSYPDLKNAKKLLNWKPKIDINQGLLKTISFYKKQNRL
jgi:nucleoside-diphosphate-sugar epimerase